MPYGDWKKSLDKVYGVLKELAGKGKRSVRLAELSLLSGYSPVYLRNILLPVLQTAFPCIKYSRGIISYECIEEVAKSE